MSVMSMQRVTSQWLFKASTDLWLCCKEWIILSTVNVANGG